MLRLSSVACCLLLMCVQGLAADRLPGTQSIASAEDFSKTIVEEIDAFLLRGISESVAGRRAFWNRNYSSRVAFENSIEPNRSLFRMYIGLVDPRVDHVEMEYITGSPAEVKVAETEQYAVYAFRWPVLNGVHGEGLLLIPKIQPVAQIVAIPDADQTPEMLAGLEPGVPSESQFARRLADLGCEVLVPVLISRDHYASGNRSISEMTDKPHREWIHLQAYEMGRTLVGFEVQKVLSAVDWFTATAGRGPVKIGVAGYGEGGLIALYSAAVEPRIQSSLVSGYFDSRQKVWTEPIYRNIWALLQEFGDAEIASMIAPRPVVFEYSAVPQVDHRGGKQAAPGMLATPKFESVRGEFQRAKMLFPKSELLQPAFTLIAGDGGTTVGPGCRDALLAFLESLGVSNVGGTWQTGGPLSSRRRIDIRDRQTRQVEELTDYTQKLLRLAEQRRKSFWSKARTTSVEAWHDDAQWYRSYFQNEIIGQVVTRRSPLNPRTRQLLDKPEYVAYEVLLDVWSGIRAWGYLLVPRNIKPAERRPVVVCQHGLGGTPESVVTEDIKNPEFDYYHAFAVRLVEQGFVVYAPYNPYKGEYRKLQRKANLLKLSLFSIIVGQHQAALDWLAKLPFVDSTKIGFYGLSYGGRTAMIVPPILERYTLSISSGNFTDWVSKRIDIYDPHCGMYGDSVELQDFGVGDTFNHAELASLMIPRPFMVERGIDDETAKPEGVGYEYNKVRRLYSTLGIGERTTIEFLPGGHRIFGNGTFEFLQKYLNWPSYQGSHKNRSIN